MDVPNEIDFENMFLDKNYFLESSENKAEKTAFLYSLSKTMFKPEIEELRDQTKDLSMFLAAFMLPRFIYYKNTKNIVPNKSEINEIIQALWIFVNIKRNERTEEQKQKMEQGFRTLTKNFEFFFHF